MIHPWLEDGWRQLVALGERMPHALLFAGPPGVGKRDLADALAARLLCVQPAADGQACGQCATCALRRAGNHPDLFVIEPPENDTQGEGDVKAPRRSGQIVIDQIRALTESLSVTGHQSARRVVVVEPAEAMNVYTANALLKLLEEPPTGCVLILVSSLPRRLLPTIRSRCRVWPVARPAPEQVDVWRAAHADSAGLLDVAGGMPLAAARMADKGLGEYLARFVRDVSRLPESDALTLAGQWESWLRGKEVATAGFDMVVLVDWMQRWVADLAALRLGGRLRFFPGQRATLERLAARCGIAAVSNCYNDLARIRRVAQHPLNTRLMLEDMLLRYVRALSGASR
tara:strand:- start:2224 stop:3252 length:1029 start_codon:yes stop_codon:yes gene_type:complete